MNYLFRYLCLLTEAERVIIEQLELTERERQVLDALLSMGASATMSKAALLQQLALSSAHFDKRCSVLLD